MHVPQDSMWQKILKIRDELNKAIVCNNIRRASESQIQLYMKD